jgi:UDP-4-amino-4-deoxy-L-arabinose-oxoglutarate aminotransferase
VILHSRPWIVEADLDAVAGVLQTGYLAQGATTGRFEAELAAWLGFPEPGVAVGCGAAALHLALHAIGVSRGDEVVLPTYVCRSVLDAVQAVGATPVLTDVGPTWVMTPDVVAPAINARTRAIIVPHMHGVFADVAAFRRFGVPIIEDCAQALDRPGRAPLAGDIVVASFHPTKCLTTGEGGYAISRDGALNRRLRDLRDGGAAPRQIFAPMPDTSAALGLSQLRRYDTALARRRSIADRYREALGERAAALCVQATCDQTMNFRFVMSCRGGVEEAEPAFARAGIVVRRGVQELLHRRVGQPDALFPSSIRHYGSTVSIPIYPAMTDAEVAQCAEALAAWAPTASVSTP